MRDASPKDGLLVQWLDGEALVYDAETDRAHCLAPLAAAVFHAADGSRSVSTIAELAGQRLGRSLGDDEVRDALAELHTKGLVELPAEDGVSRRDMMRRVAIGGAAGLGGAALVKTVVAPTPAKAQSTTASACTSSAACGANSCCCSSNGTSGTCEFASFCSVSSNCL